MTAAEVSLGLDQLRGLHLPAGRASLLQGEIVAAVAFGFLAAVLIGVVRRLKRRARTTIRRAVLHELALTRGLKPEDRLVAQAHLLRRLVRTLNGDDGVRKQGVGWSTELDSLFGTDFFTEGAGHVLTAGLYRRQAPDLDAIDAQLGRLFARLRP